MKVMEVIQQDRAVVDFLLARMEVARERGIETIVCCWPGQYVKVIEVQGYRVYPVTFDRQLSLRTLRAAVSISRIIDQERPDIVHTHFTVPGLIGRLGSRLAKHTPLVCHQVHGFYFRRLQGVRRYVYMAMEAILARWFTDYLLFQNHDDLRYARWVFGLDSARLIYIGNGIDVSRYHCHGRAPGKKVTILSAGRLEKVKNFPMLLHALARLRDAGVTNWKCVICGEGSQRSALERVVRVLHLDGIVEFKGYVSGMEEIYADADVFVLTSDMEGKPRVVMEAMAAGLPVVATDVPGTRELVIDKQTGYLVPPGDDRALACALETLLNNPELRARLGSAGAEIARKEFDERVVAERLVALFWEMTK